jgi:triphosphoribosyl-dephospho-CoA synthase
MIPERDAGSAAAASPAWARVQSGYSPCTDTGLVEARDDFRRDFMWACALDVHTRKPGNVSVGSPGHGMDAGLFLESADAAAEALTAPGLGVGECIEDAVRATRARAGCNTNLGIVLLAAPLAAAARRAAPGCGESALRLALRQVLLELDVADARAAYRGIALASPGGLGSADAQDVHDVPTVTLREAMALAADRDQIAAQYAHAYAEVFHLGAPGFLGTFEDGLALGLDEGAAARQAMLRAFLQFLAKFPDSHIVRKHGPALAHSVMAEAAPWLARARRGGLADDDAGLVAWDESLKRRGINPGTSADLAVASALVAARLQPFLAPLAAPSWLA